MLLIMTVEPGFGGQKFLDLCLPKIRRARSLIDKHGVDTWLQVDGGVSLETIERCAEAGADVFVAGSRGLLGRRPRRDGGRARARQARTDASPRREVRATPHAVNGVDRQHRASETRDTLRVYRPLVPRIEPQELACSGVGETPSRR